MTEAKHETAAPIALPTPLATGTAGPKFNPDTNPHVAPGMTAERLEQDPPDGRGEAEAADNLSKSSAPAKK